MAGGFSKISLQTIRQRQMHAAVEWVGVRLIKNMPIKLKCLIVDCSVNSFSIRTYTAYNHCFFDCCERKISFLLFAKIGYGELEYYGI